MAVSTRGRHALPGLLLGLWLIALTACGPSFEVMRENSIRFEHCNRLDWDQRVANGDRVDCWEEWRREFSQGQTLDRKRWAADRIASMRQGTAPTNPGARGYAAGPAAPAPVPSPFAAPPQRQSLVPER